MRVCMTALAVRNLVHKNSAVRWKQHRKKNTKYKITQQNNTQQYNIKYSIFSSQPVLHIYI